MRAKILKIWVDTGGLQVLSDSKLIIENECTVEFVRPHKGNDPLPHLYRPGPVAFGRLIKFMLRNTELDICLPNGRMVLIGHKK